MPDACCLAPPLGRTVLRRSSCAATVIRKQWSDHIGRGSWAGVGVAGSRSRPTGGEVCGGGCADLPMSGLSFAHTGHMDDAGRQAPRTSTSARWDVVLAGFGGWMIVIGIAVSGVLHERVSWSFAGFGVGAFAWVLTTWIRGVFLPDSPEQDAPVVRPRWLTGFAEQLGISSSYLQRQAMFAGWSSRSVRWGTQTPYLLLVAFWISLWLYWAIALAV